MKRAIYFDGENFVHTVTAVLLAKKAIRNRKQLTSFDFTYLIDFVTRQRPSKARTVKYYGAKLRFISGEAKLKKISQDIIKWNAKWVNTLNKHKIDFIKCGNLKVRDGHKCSHCGKVDRLLVEKGVDVGLAVDIVSDALKGNVDEIILFSADSDLLPAIKRAHSAGVKVIYAAFSSGINRALTTMADEVWVYSEDQVVEAFKRANK